MNDFTCVTIHQELFIKCTLWPLESNKEWKEPFIFVQGADTQLGMFQVYMEITTDPTWAQEIELAELSVRKVNEMQPKPKFYVVCGDLCHEFYGMAILKKRYYFSIGSLK